MTQLEFPERCARCGKTMNTADLAGRLLGASFCAGCTMRELAREAERKEDARVK